MKYLKIIVGFLSNSYVITGLVFITIILFTFPILPKFYTQILDSHVLRDNVVIYFYDFDKDGQSEKIVVKYNTSQNPAFNLYSNNDILIKQWNLFGEYPPIGDKLMIGDFNKNNFTEIYIFSIFQDSLFINFFEPFPNFDSKPHRKYICKINKVGGSYDFKVSAGKVIDMNNDGYSDVVFSVFAGFPLKPRKVFIYDIKNDIISSSKESANMLTNLIIYDLDGDDYNEILGTCYSPNNFPLSSSVKHLDTSCYLMVLNSDLKFVFKPIPFGSHSTIRSEPLVFYDSVFIVSLIKENNSYYNYLHLHKPNGELIRSLILQKKKINSNFEFAVTSSKRDNSIIINSGEGEVLKLNKNLDVIQSLQLSNVRSSSIYLKDLDNDRIEEILLFGSNMQEMFIYNSDFKIIGNERIPNMGGKFIFNEQHISHKNDNTSIQIGNFWYLLSIQKNSQYYIQFLYYFGILMIIFFVIKSIQYNLEAKLVKRINTEKEIFELQIKTINNEVNPHFISNVLSFIGTSVLEDDKTKADRFLTKFSKLIVSVLEKSDKITSTLKEEIDFTTNYIEIQKIRFNSNMKYSLYVSPEVELNAEIPKFFMQPYVENSIKHGFNNFQINGIIVININSNEKQILIEIIDNGLGRKATNEKKAFISTGKGLKLMEQLFALYYKLNKTVIKQEITDNNPKGTRVTLSIEKGNN